LNKILLTGSSGILGSSLLKNLNEEFIFLNLINKKRIEKKFNQIKLKNLDKNSLKKLVDGFGPDVILHCAAITDIEFCEKNKKKCKEINYYFTKYLVDICKKLKIKFIFVSTDQIYNKNYPQKEISTPKIYNYYAETKILCEEYIEKNLTDYLILRTNFFGNSLADRKSFSDFIINNLKKNNKIYLFKDVYFNPLIIDNFSILIKRLISQNSVGKFNVGTNKGISKYNFGLKIAKILNLKSQLIIKDLIVKRENLSKRSLDMRMNISKIKKIIKNKNLFDLDKNINQLKR
jgi:dTDP-4-dehydrorhamnose reductase